ncbi:MAG: hypothetical protein KBT35_01685 [Firmicutes bacterium]|nr:hypothetical protein [Candidatus Colivicinus equi]
MNARQKAKYYKKKYLETKEILNTKLFQKIKYIKPPIQTIESKTVLYSDQEKYINNHTYKPIEEYIKSELIQIMKNEISQYIDISCEEDYLPDAKIYRGRISIIDERYS